MNDFVYRAIRANDTDLLLKIYKSTRDEELAQITDWSEEQKLAFVRQQFFAQHDYYQKVYYDGFFYILTYESEDIGRLYLHYGTETLRIIDISLLPQWRNKKIGSSIIESLKKDASSKKLSLSIHVETFNPALNLYTRLGFKKIKETNGVYWLMEWKP